MATAHIHHPASGHDDDTSGVNRREFLYYLLGGSAALIAAGSCGAVAWFTTPRTRTPFGDDAILIIPADIPSTLLSPVRYELPVMSPVSSLPGPVWLTATEKGVLALSGFCTYQSIGVSWSDLRQEFECVSCNGKFHADGTYISGRPHRGLDRFPIHVVTRDGVRSTSPAGEPVKIENVTEVYVDVGRLIPGPARQV